ncbi:MAG: DUF488 family protein [Planctomycetales bacterium]|nr:DUF488 family protein [Planctomycetales bacterium]NIP69223.1 DUF488 family protein [Planctomycetales bacterium]
MHEPTVFTIGHSNHPWDKFLDLLQRHAIQALVDIRRYPRSRRWPQFHHKTLSRSLAEQGVAYQWLEALGGRREGQANFASPNLGIQDTAFRHYADHMLGEVFGEGVQRLLQIAARETTAIMCAEGDFRQCHRRLVSDYLLAHGTQVRHILPSGEWARHALSPPARFAEGTLTYPGPRTLFD